MYNPSQSDIIWIDFSPSKGKEIRGKRPAVVVSSNAYNKKTNYIIVCPITTGGNDFIGYVDLQGYAIEGRINATQLHSFDLSRIASQTFVDKLRAEDLVQVKQILDYALEIDI
ncbi:type II toxin-antitoxin system PemK/MazF family toxin [Listeria booriae]|uniref:Type II toxin-antitoxin system PemK/MazF family toxin n=1 Tax=Listeria booriae TaxID=1552123 RepID=A0A7X1DA14_9LIST|nr:type II toxin-antitoxin system PemK/MazF family toxin [Listeria booriae]MBC1491003.1 type II toxin-antitoxin system PemK/MazF family toxin [Listeria booriae]MBC1491082.1 type II toxin-antitoxin system PemK/MazF family toxin [Listeria booriae]MBC1492431.1 type II toxin-antitoxin system PemK/MazF family toxin [Listeria booriae]MBC1504064.1 type II toxin-antitoxin system PemK/MazF family toxin [Listeria booriae]MBC1524275.1 type II toxin-antitoxin system PemK/MazF family toxin [Listeria booria